ncbi:MAG: bifunctional folylpolyglutamate synthase/dihydrofolate synthase [Nitrospirae bacterium]|nr:bifunctional folylpolyglutamate synthase/dihydrofolate synthase [Nitrospirota bacterium]
MTYQKTLEYLFLLQKNGMKLGLSSMFELLSNLNNPHQNLKTIHVGGTNGKGSTCSTLAACLQVSGYKVGLYTSPHLIDFSERVVVNSIPIAQKDVIRLTRSIMNSMKHTPTFFEFTTAMAFLYFLEQQADIAVIEVGLGGRLDSTNVLTPLVSVITNIDYDHQEYLGSTLFEIGNEKAGIIKKGVPVVSGVSQPGVRDLISRTAASLNAPVFRLGSDFSFKSLTSAQFQSFFDYKGINRSFSNLSTPLLGEHQKANVSLALAALELILEKGFKVTEEHLREGIQKVDWPGRIEIIKEKPLMILDGAHNPAGARVLAEFLRGLNSSGNKYLILGIMKDKDIYKIGEALFPWADEIILTQPHFQRAAPPQDLREALPPTSKPVHLIETISETLRFLRTRTLPDDIICFAGSLYTIGEVKAALEGIHITVPLHG